ncbi:recombinase family protein [Streptosporangium lutulentum]|uniref:Resolvase/invertase-type recombinase catalytic domain-containing protein n=1 Tax=Streptosporangium lutulentum TaxID=1461250 RepID=A0ABT9Q8G0_9ACTN|nr:recombinase family protein [Streptosporangium lutulentum]MDP9842676.1 hypothetical protein [Streptosporangium lutulentum]
MFTVTKFDRFARNMAEANDILTGLSGRGVLFGLGASVYDWNDPFGRLFLQTLAMVAEFEANSGYISDQLSRPTSGGTIFGRDSRSGSYECSPTGGCQARVCLRDGLVKTD